MTVDTPAVDCDAVDSDGPLIPLVPLIAGVKGNSLDDGPGIRGVVFFKGCPLRCAWCHNPETQRLHAELSFDVQACVGSRTCVAVCPQSALDLGHAGFVVRDRCDRCGLCAEQCPSRALTMIGEKLSVDDLVCQLLRYATFYRTSNGGITLSGGEPLIYAEFCGMLLSRIREHRLHSIVETCGQFSYAKFVKYVAPVVDEVYFDLKLIDDGAHTRYCGVSNRLILENFRKLCARARAGEIALLPRIPIVATITATDDNLRAIASLLREEGIGRVSLLAYHPLGEAKGGTIGKVIDEEVRRLPWVSPSSLRSYFSQFDGFEFVAS